MGKLSKIGDTTNLATQDGTPLPGTFRRPLTPYSYVFEEILFDEILRSEAKGRHALNDVAFRQPF
jgi:hypothetical protein